MLQMLRKNNDRVAVRRKFDLAFVSAGYLPMYPFSVSDGYLVVCPLLYPLLYPNTLLRCSNYFPALWYIELALPLRRVVLRISTPQFTTAFSIVFFSKLTTPLSDLYFGSNRGCVSLRSTSLLYSIGQFIILLLIVQKFEPCRGLE